MANRRFCGWQRSLLIGLVATIVSVVASCSLRVGRSVDQGIIISAKLPGHHSQPNVDSSEVKASIIDPKETYSKVVAQWAKLNNLKIQNLPLPAQFQGKTSREIKLKAKDDAKATSIKAIALTFDDGPWLNTTSKILAILKQQKIKATFFVIGKHVKLYPQLIKQVVAEGHAVGNHTWSHEYGYYSQAAAARELDETAKLVYQTTGVKTVLFRPPAGILNNGLVAAAQEKKYAVIMWSVDSRDWRYRGSSSSQSLVESVLKEAKPGGIVLMHDGGGDRTTTVQALPKIITQLKKQGYTFVTVPELLEMGKG